MRSASAWQSIDTLLYAFKKGINFVDTAELYGKGRSEEVIGKALREWRGDKIYVATKAQPTKWPSPDLDHPEMRGRYPNWYLRESVEASLRRLGVERIDLFQLHCWLADGLTTLDWLETLNALRVEGKIDREALDDPPIDRHCILRALRPAGGRLARIPSKFRRNTTLSGVGFRHQRVGKWKLSSRLASMLRVLPDRCRYSRAGGW